MKRLRKMRGTTRKKLVKNMNPESFPHPIVLLPLAIYLS